MQHRLEQVLAHHTGELRVPPRRAAQMLRLTTLSMTHPLLSEGEVFTAFEITELLLHGMAAPASARGRPPAPHLTHPAAPSND